MALQLGDTAPDFKADTSVGPISFHQWLGDHWGVLFSHPRDFTPVCTTELGYTEKLAPEFARRGVKVIGLSVDRVDDHARWADDIEATQGARPRFPLIGDQDRAVALREPRVRERAGGELGRDAERGELDAVPAREVLGVQAARPALAQGALRGVAGELAPRAAHRLARQVGARAPEHRRHLVLDEGGRGIVGCATPAQSLHERPASRSRAGDSL